MHHDEATLTGRQKSQYRGRNTGRHIDDEVVNFFTQVAECLHDAGRLQLAQCSQLLYTRGPWDQLNTLAGGDGDFFEGFLTR